MSSDERLGVALHDPLVVVIDYSAPNIAKEMHVGHLRSTIIGDASARLLEWLGYTVIRQNHVGDWGTPFGMLIEHVVDVGGFGDATAVGDLDALYKASRQRFDGDSEFRDRARERVVLLQGGDQDTVQVWQWLVGVSRQYFNGVYERLDVTLKDDDLVGESSYQNELESTVAELEAKGLLEESGGAVCAFLDGYTARDGSRLPLIVRKSDGGYGYAATDLAAIRRRARVLGARRILYVVGAPQSQHLAMVFELARRAGWLDEVSAEHIGFGSVLGPDGKMLRSRAGAAVKLSDLLAEAVDRARELIDARGSRLPDGEEATLAHQLGVGAVKYADLSTDRTKDYAFDLTRMVALDGDTAPYLQYAHARIRSILRKHVGELGSQGEVEFEKPVERDLALRLIQFADVLESVAESVEFHRLTRYLFGLATTFSSFYEQCPVLHASDRLRASRLTLCDVTAKVLKRGLWVLGIEAPERI
jgi:arginyl-tRNA synthetase